MISYFKLYLLPHLLIFWQLRDPSYMYLPTKAVLQIWHIKWKRANYLQIELMFSRHKLIQMSVSINISCKSKCLIKLHWCSWLFLMAISNSYIIFFDFQKSYSFPFKRITNYKLRFKEIKNTALSATKNEACQKLLFLHKRGIF